MTRQYNPMSDQLARHTGIPVDAILELSQKAEQVLRSLKVAQGSGVVGTNNRAVEELVDAGLITLKSSIDFGYSRATIVTVDSFVMINDGTVDIVITGPNSFKARYGFDALNAWPEWILDDYTRYMKSHTAAPSGRPSQ